MVWQIEGQVNSFLKPVTSSETSFSVALRLHDVAATTSKLLRTRTAPSRLQFWRTCLMVSLLRGIIKREPSEGASSRKIRAKHRPDVKAHRRTYLPPRPKRISWLLPNDRPFIEKPPDCASNIEGDRSWLICSWGSVSLQCRTTLSTSVGYSGEVADTVDAINSFNLKLIEGSFEEILKRGRKLNSAVVTSELKVDKDFDSAVGSPVSVGRRN